MHGNECLSFVTRGWDDLANSGKTFCCESPFEGISAWGQVCPFPWLPLTTSQGQRRPLHLFSWAHAAVDRWCQEALTQVSMRSRWCPPCSGVPPCALLLGTRVMLINGWVRELAKMQALQAICKAASSKKKCSHCPGQHKGTLIGNCPRTWCSLHGLLS